MSQLQYNPPSPGSLEQMVSHKVALKLDPLNRCDINENEVAGDILVEDRVDDSK